MRVFIIASVAAFAGLCGCSSFTFPKQKPVIEDRVTNWGAAKIGVLATTPERRVVLVKVPEMSMCSEAPADVAESVASAITAAIDAQKSGAGNANAGLTQQLASSVLQLGYRSQGGQLYRDGVYSLCVMYLNGALPQDEFVKAHRDLLQRSDKLIDKEISHIAEIKKATAAHLNAPNIPPIGKNPNISKDGSASSKDAALDSAQGSQENGSARASSK